MVSITGHCLHCKANHTILHPHRTHTGNHWFVQGKCSKCHGNISKPIPTPDAKGQHGSGQIANTLSQIPILGGLLGPLASMFGGGMEVQRTAIPKGSPQKISSTGYHGLGPVRKVK